jgi:hypothetical protein
MFTIHSQDRSPALTARSVRRRRRDPTPSPTGRHGHRTIRGVLLAIAVLSAVCLPTQSTAHAAPVTASRTGIGVDGPCYWNLCLDAEPDGSLTAWSLWDIGPTPYYISVFNETTGTRLARCGSGSSCRTSSYIGPPLQRCYTYVAFVGGSGASIPPSPVQRTSARFTKCNPLN